MKLVSDLDLWRRVVEYPLLNQVAATQLFYLSGSLINQLDPFLNEELVFKSGYDVKSVIY